MLEQQPAGGDGAWWLSDQGRPHGPHSEASVATGLTNGAISPQTYAFPTRGGEWKRLCEWPAFTRACAIAPAPQYSAGSSLVEWERPALARGKSSGVALSSFVIALVGLVVHFVLVMIAAVSVARGLKGTEPLMIATGLLIIAMLGANVIGGVLGLVAISQRVSNKWMAVMGIVLNALEFLAIIGLMVIGHSRPH